MDGPPLGCRHLQADRSAEEPDPVLGVAFSGDVRSLIAIDVRGNVRTWPIAGPAVGAPDVREKRIAARTGLKLDADQEVVLDPETWRRLRRDEAVEPVAINEPAAELAWHDAAREAEQMGRGFAARWHLDRLIAARPDDGLLHARLCVRGLDGHTDRAVADESRALELGPRDRILDWLVQEAEDLRFAGGFDAALRLLDRVLADRPKDWGLHAVRAMVLGGLGKGLEREAELEQAVALGADDVFLGQLAQERAEAGQWPSAAPLYRRLRARFRDDPGILRQLDRILAPRLPAVIRGDDKPGDAEEEVAFAYLACGNRQFRPGARLFAGAFRTDPKLAEDMTARFRYKAACAAVMAASSSSPLMGQGQDGGDEGRRKPRAASPQSPPSRQRRCTGESRPSNGSRRTSPIAQAGPVRSAPGQGAGEASPRFLEGRYQAGRHPRSGLVEETPGRGTASLSSLLGRS